MDSRGTKSAGTEFSRGGWFLDVAGRAIFQPPRRTFRRSRVSNCRRPHASSAISRKNDFVEEDSLFLPGSYDSEDTPLYQWASIVLLAGSCPRSAAGLVLTSR